MKYLLLDTVDRVALLGGLEAMPAFLHERFAALTAEEARVEGPEKTFSPVEQCWHLADLEREGFGVRIRLLLEEKEPRLPDFDGARVARERDYRGRSLVEGLAEFQGARGANLERLRGLEADQWSRAGTQDGVGRIMLCDLPQMMVEHDAAHRTEIDAWVVARSSPRR